MIRVKTILYLFHPYYLLCDETLNYHSKVINTNKIDYRINLTSASSARHSTFTLYHGTIIHLDGILARQ
jgi:hypothetical protein